MFLICFSLLPASLLFSSLSSPLLSPLPPFSPLSSGLVLQTPLLLTSSTREGGCTDILRAWQRCAAVGAGGRDVRGDAEEGRDGRVGEEELESSNCQLDPHPQRNCLQVRRSVDEGEGNNAENVLPVSQRPVDQILNVLQRQRVGVGGQDESSFSAVCPGCPASSTSASLVGDSRLVLETEVARLARVSAPTRDEVDGTGNANALSYQLLILACACISSLPSSAASSSCPISLSPPASPTLFLLSQPALLLLPLCNLPPLFTSLFPHLPRRAGTHALAAAREKVPALKRAAVRTGREENRGDAGKMNREMARIAQVTVRGRQRRLARARGHRRMNGRRKGRWGEKREMKRRGGNIFTPALLAACRSVSSRKVSSWAVDTSFRLDAERVELPSLAHAVTSPYVVVHLRKRRENRKLVLRRRSCRTGGACDAPVLAHKLPCRAQVAHVLPSCCTVRPGHARIAAGGGVSDGSGALRAFGAEEGAGEVGEGAWRAGGAGGASAEVCEVASRAGSALPS
eukprot:748990-Hanusia_phi.AAC.2